MKEGQRNSKRGKGKWQKVGGGGERKKVETGGEEEELREDVGRKGTVEGREVRKKLQGKGRKASF